jgi:hypothetical protein
LRRLHELLSLRAGASAFAHRTFQGSAAWYVDRRTQLNDFTGTSRRAASLPNPCVYTMLSALEIQASRLRRFTTPRRVPWTSRVALYSLEC